jgi:4-aminobutyrate aminotransferase-like enzyme
VFLVCTGSEANDLARRIARQVTGRQDVVVLDGAYHGNTGVVTGISPNRYKGPGGAGAPPTTHEVPILDRYRGAYGYDDLGAGAKFAADAARHRRHPRRRSPAGRAHRRIPDGLGGQYRPARWVPGGDVRRRPDGRRVVHLR